MRAPGYMLAAMLGALLDWEFVSVVMLGASGAELVRMIEGVYKGKAC